MSRMRYVRVCVCVCTSQDYNYMRRNALELLTPQDEMVWALPMAKGE